jgi:hypothetical protein
MTDRTTRQGVLFKGLAKRAVVTHFDQAHASSDGGAVLLKACDERLGRCARLAACLRDDRQPAKVRHQHIRRVPGGQCYTRSGARPRYG